ncbi:uncharacterized protein PHACADRAFT_260456 [Phanerochaete carnosa HHB-10118-sp]|uniref:Uncharacterized protein n=1 Tax=Phanerochaete carnosa (strain HHB-10118-sp) TaxID=650164 RepID=K5W016_PHACS|nr:uncharacterized protein PHACADRAFT_260456 [Phanerochaete carnosa HHB-10118-sp]EKM52224.1 hypothetical protein PHACADRAFT_260456 [Phanerochaete carnosa HHB-10118-sp]
MAIGRTHRAERPPVCDTAARVHTRDERPEEGREVDGRERELHAKLRKGEIELWLGPDSSEQVNMANSRRRGASRPATVCAVG